MQRRFLKSSITSGLALFTILGVQPAAHATKPIQATQNSTTNDIQDHLNDGEKILAVGEDGFVRTVNTHDSGNHGRGEIRNDLRLAIGDTITLSEKWTWRVAGAMTCGATGVINVLGGAACGLAWAGAEDKMDIYNRAC